MQQKAVVSALRAVGSTWKITAIGDLPEQGEAGVVAFWHGGMLPVWKYFAPYSPSALVSKSSDGSLLTALLQTWNYTVVRGSSSQGGKEALEQMVQLAKTSLVLVTPDGPRGPRHVCKPGAIIAAVRANVPLYLCRVRSNGIVLQKSWDKFTIPYPFARISMTCHKMYNWKDTSLPTREEISAFIVQAEQKLLE